MRGWCVVAIGLVACGGPVGPDELPAGEDTDDHGPAAVLVPWQRDTGPAWSPEDTDVHGETGVFVGHSGTPTVDTSPIDTSPFEPADTAWFVAVFGDDDDGDGYHDALPPPGTPAGHDCDDANARVHPGAVEVWYDDVDQDCDEASDWDRDGDGHELVGSPLGGDDCDDLLATRHPALVETCNGYDDDCDELADEDDPDLLASFLATGSLVWGVDGDGDGAVGEDGLVALCGPPPPGLEPLMGRADCDDADPDVHPSAPDTVGDGADHDCDGSDG